MTDSTDFVIDLVKRDFPNATEQQIEDAAQLARDNVMKRGGGIAQLYQDTDAKGGTVVKGEIALAMRETMAKLKAKGETAITAAEFEDLEGQRLCFGKAGAASPLKHRGEYVKKYGVEKFNAAMKIWQASPSDLSPRKNPFAKSIKKAMREQREGTLENTPFNNSLYPDQVRQPKQPKVKLPPGPFNLTQLGALYKSDPATAKLVAQRNGLKLP
jgi:hypothetical protein